EEDYWIADAASDDSLDGFVTFLDSLLSGPVGADAFTKLQAHPWMQANDGDALAYTTALD
ncbi:MAG: hypothetical protein ACI8RZ_006902, partial [Myxococcota bacterium]